MTNKTFISAGKEILIELLSQCTEGQQMKFKRMYCADNLNFSINDAVEQIDPNKIDYAITQCEKTLEGLNKENTELITAIISTKLLIGKIGLKKKFFDKHSGEVVGIEYIYYNTKYKTFELKGWGSALGKDVDRIKDIIFNPELWEESFSIEEREWTKQYKNK